MKTEKLAEKRRSPPNRFECIEMPAVRPARPSQFRSRKRA